MTNVYQAPEASLDPEISTNGFGSVESAVAGNYTLEIGAVLSEAWAKTKGSKGTVWLAYLLILVIMIPLMMVPMFIMSAMGLGDGAVGTVVMFAVQIAANLLILPMMGGLMMIGIKRAVGAPVSVGEVFGHFGKTLTLFACVILMYLTVLIGLLLFILPGIYLLVAYSLAIPLILEKNLGPWEALQVSRKAITHKWFTFLGLGLVVMLIYFVGAIVTLGIGIIWIIPFMFLVMGVVYRTLFGYNSMQA